MFQSDEDTFDLPSDLTHDTSQTSQKKEKKDKKKKKKNQAETTSPEDSFLPHGFNESSNLTSDVSGGYGSLGLDQHDSYNKPSLDDRHHYDQDHDHDHDNDYDEQDQEEREEQERLIKMAKSKYDMKNHMANERTFFKYLFTGLHIGGIGTLVLSFFASDEVSKLYLVLFIWIVAFGFMFWGLYSYYLRKRLMETGHFKETQLLNPHTPLMITIIFVSVIALVVAYAMFSNQYPAKGSRNTLQSKDASGDMTIKTNSNRLRQAKKSNVALKNSVGNNKFQQAFKATPNPQLKTTVLSIQPKTVSTLSKQASLVDGEKENTPTTKKTRNDNSSLMIEDENLDEGENEIENDENESEVSSFISQPYAPIDSDISQF